MDTPSDLSRPVLDSSSSDSFGGSNYIAPTERHAVYQDVFLGAGTPKQLSSFEISGSPSDTLPVQPVTSTMDNSIRSPTSMIFGDDIHLFGTNSQLP